MAHVPASKSIRSNVDDTPSDLRDDLRGQLRALSTAEGMESGNRAQQAHELLEIGSAGGADTASRFGSNQGLSVLGFQHEVPYLFT